MLRTLRLMETPRGPRDKKIGVGTGRLPVRDLIQFLETTGDAQLECAKQCLWKLSFNASLFPPAILFRRILSLQAAEKPLDTGNGHRPRDHVRHLVYLVILGAYIFTEDPDIRRRFDRQATYQKRRHALGAANNVDLFVQAWLSFCIFHDIGYPIERFHSASNGKVRRTIEASALDVYRDLPNAYAEEYATRALSNLCALVSLLEYDDGRFDDLVESHLSPIHIQKLKADCAGLGAVGFTFEDLRGSRPLALFGSTYAGLLAEIMGDRMLIAVLESESSGKILWLGNRDGSVEAACGTLPAGRNARDIAFGNGMRGHDDVSVKYYPCYPLTGRDVIAAVIPASAPEREGAVEGVLQVVRDLMSLDEFRRSARTTEAQTLALSGVAYSALCGTRFVDQSRQSRFKKVEPAEVVRAAIEQHLGEVVAQLAKSFEQALRVRTADRTFAADEILRTVPRPELYLQLTRDALETDRILDIVRAQLTKPRSPPATATLDVNALRESTLREFQKVSRMIVPMARTLEGAVQPGIEENVRREHAVNRIFQAWDEPIRAIIARAMKSERMAPVKKLTTANVKAPDFIRKLYGDDGFGSGAEMLAHADRTMIGLIGEDYDPKWHVDHGFYAAAMALWSSSLRLAVLEGVAESKERKSEEDTIRARMVKLMTFNPSALVQDDGVEAATLKSTTDLCYRSIFLHNFYPDFSASHKDLQHAMGGNPFTYFALLADALQNWDRDVQYDPGRFDLMELKPDGIYDIFRRGDRLCVVVDRTYVDEEKLIELKKNLASYLRDFDAIVDIQLG